MEQFQELLAQMEDFGREGFPYRDAARARAELRLRECIRRAFGDKSPEFQTHRNYKLLVGNAQETKQSLSFVKALMAALEDKKLELQGLKPIPPPEPAAPPPTPTPASMPVRPPQMKLVPSTTPTAQVTITPAAPVVPPPMTVSVALTTNLDMAGSSQASAPAVQSPPVPPAPTKSSAPPLPSPPPPTMKPAVEVQQTPPPQPPVADPSPKEAPVTQKTPVSPPVERSAQPVTQKKTETPSAPAPQSAQSIEPASKPAPVAFLSGQDTQEFVKHLCNRFHAVTRQLRLRKEYRATLDVEDELDVQDLIHVMLRFQFDDVETDEWTPDYAEGSPRKTFLINHGRLAIVAKKTRPGLTPKELAEQVKTDAARYSGRNRCSTLLCFIYDPEGRIGNPRGLEADLTSVSDQFTVDVLVTPK
jgi:hypothetical protein